MLQEYPWTNNLAQFLAIFSLSMVILSTITFIISTADELQMDEEGQIAFPTIVAIIEWVDNFVIVFFSIEYLARLVLCPNKIKFLKDPMNIIDITAIIPFYLSLLLVGLEDFEIIGKTGKMIRLVRVMRILRIFKLVRHFAGLQSLYVDIQFRFFDRSCDENIMKKIDFPSLCSLFIVIFGRFFTLQQAYQELGLLLVLVVVAILTYSSLVYFAERDGQGKVLLFTSRFMFLC